jgi:hypothetical protein
MPIIADIVQEKQRVSEQLGKVDAERSRLQDRLNELEVAERVLSRFGQKPSTSRGEVRATPPQAKRLGDGPRPATRQQRATRSEAQLLPLGEATLRAVKAHASGVSADEVRDYLARHFGLSVRPNHLGMALQRHRRAGLLEIRDSRWHALR